MALFKEIRQADGVITNYHRVLFVQITTNQQNSVAVLSYVDVDSRAITNEDASIEPYQKAITFETDYDPNMTIEAAYDFLKTLPQFAGSEDV